MAEQPKGPPTYFPSIEAKYGRSITDWLSALESSGMTSHKDLVNWLKSEHGLGHGHANALVAYHLKPENWPWYILKS